MAVTAGALVAGCAGVPTDLGREDVDALVTDRGRSAPSTLAQPGEDDWQAAIVAEPLSVERAVRIALVNNPRLKAAYASLGFGAAEVYEAGRIRNPSFGAVRLDSNVAGELDQISLGLASSFADLITMPARKRLAAGAFAALKQTVAAEVLSVAADVERAYFSYVGASQVAALRAQTAKAAGLAAALAERYHDAGNLTAGELALERAAASEARIASLDAERAQFAARTEIAAVLSLSVGEPWSAPDELNLPPEREPELEVLLDLAERSRLDIAAARGEAAMRAAAVDYVQWSRWVGELDIGVERERETDGARLRGPTLEWEVPIFSRHKDARLRAMAELRIAEAEVERLRIAIDNEIRLAYAGLANARDRIAEYREFLIPARVEAVARAQEEVNFMLIGIFELIGLKQREYDAYQGYLEAVRDYWLARADLGLAVGSALPAAGGEGGGRLRVQDLLAPPGSKMDHSGHGAGATPTDRHHHHDGG